MSDFSEHAGAITALQIYRDDAHILSASRDRSFMCWDLRREKRVSSHTQQQGGLNDLCLSRDQSLVITVGQERKVQMWDLREAGPVQTICPAAGATGEALCVAAAHASDVIATGGSDGVVRFWDLRHGGRAMAECVEACFPRRCKPSSAAPGNPYLPAHAHTHLSSFFFPAQVRGPLWGRG